MKYSKAHGLGSTERARALVDEAFAYYREQFASYNPVATWSSPEQGPLTVEALGKKLAVHVSLTNDRVDLEGDLPLLLRPFSSKITSVLDGKIAEWATKKPT